MKYTLFNQLGLPDHARHVAQMIQDYDPTLFLERLPQGHLWLIQNPDRPYALIHRPVGLPEYVIESFSEGWLDERIFARVLEWDTRRFGKQLDKFDALNAARHLSQLKAQEDRLAEDSERMLFHLKKGNGPEGWRKA